MPADSTGNDRTIRIEPDLEFIRSLRDRAGETLKKCFQCGTCSSTCELSPDDRPFPRKEMIWAVWGMKDRLLADPDVWLCHQCNDCSIRCPRGARPGDVLAAVRRESVVHHAFPGFIARWVNEPQCIPLLLGIPALLLALALFVRAPIEGLLGIAKEAEGQILFAYSRMFPHWLLNTLFLLATGLSVYISAQGVKRFWAAMRSASGRATPPVKPVGASVGSVLKAVILHRDFGKCTAARPRFVAHLFVFFGFLALLVVTLWVITIQLNPLARGEFVYPFGFWSPFKILANLGGAAVLLGCLMMIVERLKEDPGAGVTTYFDWNLLGLIVLVVVTGFATEALHFQRLEPHRHVIYFAHLVFVLSFILYLPYSKLAHMVYRVVAMVYAEHTGRHGKGGDHAAS